MNGRTILGGYLIAALLCIGLPVLGIYAPTVLAWLLYGTLYVLVAIGVAGLMTYVLD